MLNGVLRACAATIVLTGCGGGGSSDSPSEPLLSTHRNCRFQFVQGGSGLGPSHYAYRCPLVSGPEGCDLTEPCTGFVTPVFPECGPGRTTCTPCPPNQISC